MFKLIIAMLITVVTSLSAGDGRVKNIDEAVQWFVDKSKMGKDVKLDPSNECTPGNKAGGFKTDEESYRCYLKKARLGGYEEQVVTCNLYAYAKGTHKNLKKAKYWCKKGIERGHPNASKLWYDFELWNY